METLTNGFKKPEDGDKGQTVFDALELNIQLVNDHNHNGTNSEKILAYNLTKPSQNILAANWANPVNDVYSQVVAMPANVQFDSATIIFRETSTGKSLLLSYEKVTATSLRVFCNDTTKNVTIIYG